MEAKFTAMLAAARDTSLNGASQAQQMEVASNAATAAAVASVRELLRDQEQRRQAALAGTGGDAVAEAAPLFKAPQVFNVYISLWMGHSGLSICKIIFDQITDDRKCEKKNQIFLKLIKKFENYFFL